MGRAWIFWFSLSILSILSILGMFWWIRRKEGFQNTTDTNIPLGPAPSSQSSQSILPNTITSSSITVLNDPSGKNLSSAIATAKSQNIPLIRIMPGQYKVSSTIVINQPGLTIEGIPDANGKFPIIHGSSEIPKEQFELVNDTAIRFKSQYVYKTKVNPAILSAITRRGFTWGGATTELDVHYKGVQFKRSRWPRNQEIGLYYIINKGTASPNYGGNFITAIQGEEIPNFGDVGTIWCTGVKAWDWVWTSNKVISLTPKPDLSKSKWLTNTEYANYRFLGVELQDYEPSGNGIIWNDKGFRVYFENIYNELQPNEYFVDFKNNLVYIALLEPISESFIFTDTKTDFFRVISDNITIRNIDFRYNRESAITGVNIGNTIIENCVFEYLNTAIGLTCKSNNIIRSCILRNMASNAITLLGGENCQVLHCDISRFGQYLEVYTAAIQLYNNGTLFSKLYRIANNTIYEFPHPGIILRGQQHTVENNIIYNGCYKFMDLGYIYAFADKNIMDMRGTVIRNNMLYNLINKRGKAVGIYMDNQTSGITILNNVFYRFLVPEDPTSVWGISINGGCYCEIIDNLFIDVHKFIDINQINELDVYTNILPKYNTIVPTLSQLDKPALKMSMDIPFTLEKYYNTNIVERNEYNNTSVFPTNINSFYFFDNSSKYQGRNIKTVNVSVIDTSGVQITITPNDLPCTTNSINCSFINGIADVQRLGEYELKIPSKQIYLNKKFCVFGGTRIGADTCNLNGYTNLIGADLCTGVSPFVVSAPAPTAFMAPATAPTVIMAPATAPTVFMAPATAPTAFMAPAPTSFTNISADDFLTQKYGEYQPATNVGSVDVVAQTIPELEGKEFLTLADLKTVKLAIDNQITRLETIRSSSATYQKKQTDLEELSFRLSNIISAIERKDASLSDYPIRIETAKKFLEKFKQLDSVPPLFDISAVASVPAPEDPPLYTLVQKLKMELEQLATTDIDSTYLTRITALEKRILGNSMLGNPIPNDLRTEFLTVLKQVYTNLVIQ